MALSALPPLTARGAPIHDRSARRPPGLHDVALVIATDGGLARPDGGDVSLSAADLVALVHEAGAADCDLRILTPPGEQNLPMLRAVARRLGRDVLIAPIGSEIVRTPAMLPSPDDGGPAAAEEELVPVDAVTGHPVDWQIVQPSGQVGTVFGWFELVGGLVTPRNGLVALPLPDGGRILATRETFVRARAAATTVRAGHPGLVTIGVQVRSGDFVLGYYDRRTARVDGIGLAAALSTLPLYQRHVRLWLRWPSDEGGRRRLRANVTDFAEVTGATVWVPTEPGEAVLLDGCLDLAAVGPGGGVSSWQPYGPALPFESDVDGRLVPAGGVHVAHLRAAALVSGHPTRERDLAERQDLARTPATSFPCDLAVLADGRLAVRYRDGSLLAVGGRQFAELLREAGWTGADVLLLSSVTPEQAPGTRRHLADLVTHIGAPIRLANPPADLASPPGDSAQAGEPDASARTSLPRPRRWHHGPSPQRHRPRRLSRRWFGHSWASQPSPSRDRCSRPRHSRCRPNQPPPNQPPPSRSRREFRRCLPPWPVVLRWL